MNRDEAISQFLKQNMSALTSPELTRGAYKALFRKYFVEHLRKGAGLPSPLEIQEALAIRLAGGGIDPTALETDYLHKLPIFKEMGEAQRERILQRVKSASLSSGLTPEDLKTIRDVGAYKAVTIHHGAAISDEKQAELRRIEEKISRKKQEYEELPSVLDAEALVEPDYSPEREAVQEWWQRFYLRDNPFRRKDGLSSIPEDLYESVVLKTRPFKDVLAILQRDPAALFGTASLLIGDYGYGKTTFLDYLGYHLVQNGIVPLRITCGRPFPDAHGFIGNFYVLLRTALMDELRSRKQGAMIIEEQQTVESHVMTLCRETIKGGARGVVVFLDDYHRAQSQKVGGCQSGVI